MQECNAIGLHITKFWNCHDTMTSPSLGKLNYIIINFNFMKIILKVSLNLDGTWVTLPLLAF